MKSARSEGGFTEADVLQVIAFFDADDSRPSFSEFDGFITAVVSGPEMISPTEWLDIVLGNEDSRHWKSPKQFQIIVETLLKWNNFRALELLEAPDDFIPYLDEMEFEEEALYEERLEKRVIIDATSWCRGYMRGVALRSDAWAPLFDSEDYYRMVPILAYAVGNDGTGLSETAIKMFSDEAENMIGGSAREVYKYWLERRAPQTVRRGKPKVSPNASCPCGSGKKYKRCCGAAG